MSQYKKCIVAEIWPRGLYCKMRLRVYCRKIVLQYRGVQWKNCIAILVLYCDLKG